MTRDAIVTCFLPTNGKINLESIPVVWHIVLMSIEPVENPCRIIIIKTLNYMLVVANEGVMWLLGCTGWLPRYASGC